MMKSYLFFRWSIGLIIGVLALTVVGCDNEPSTPFPLANSSGGSSSSPPPGGSCADLEFKSFDEAIDGGYYSFAYGTIQRTDPVLDLFDWNPVDEKGRTSCDGGIEPALRISVELSDSTWDAKDEATIVVGINGGAWHASKASPYVEAGSQQVTWSDGHKYFREGDRVGMLGAFSEHGYFRVGTTNFFTVDADGNIANFRRSKCLHGDLNGMSLNDVIARSHKAQNGKKSYIEPEPTSPLNSVCTD